MSITETDDEGRGDGLHIFLKLQKLRADKGLSRIDLSKISGVGVSTLQKMEARKCCRLIKVMSTFNALNAEEFYNNTLVRDDYIKPCGHT